MEAKGSSGQSSVYNTYATPPTPNPLFLGFSRYLNDKNFKEILYYKPQNLSVLGFFLSGNQL